MNARYGKNHAGGLTRQGEISYAMDLTKCYPRGPRERLIGVAMLARTIDKARALLAGTIGDYYFDCPMDKQLFAALGVTSSDFLNQVSRSTDAEVLDWLLGRAALPSGAALEAHNRAIESWAPKSAGGRARFAQQREKIAPGRADVTTWTELIDIEERRTAPAAG
jgi:hypothetical protein